MRTATTASHKYKVREKAPVVSENESQRKITSESPGLRRSIIEGQVINCSTVGGLFERFRELAKGGGKDK